MSIKALQEYTIYAKYAKYNVEEKRRETWDEQIDRVFDMHERRFTDELETIPEFRKNFDFAKQQVLKRRVLGSQRALQFGGPSIEKHEAKMFNCIVSYCDRERFFQECMYLLLCFHPDTEVKVRGGVKKISELTCNDEILAHVEDSGEFVWVKPSNVFETPSKGKRKLKITFEDDTEVKCTEDHQFFTTNRGWVEAKDLSDEDDVKFFDNK